MWMHMAMAVMKIALNIVLCLYKIAYGLSSPA
jgi:hypothetical protein